VQAKLFMDGHFAEPIDLAAICWEASFSKFHFIRLFREVYGATPKAYLSGLRMDRASQLLDQGLPVADACLGAGFESAPTFCRAFRKRMGTTPAAYRKARPNAPGMCRRNRWTTSRTAMPCGWVGRSKTAIRNKCCLSIGPSFAPLKRT
jgi:AraC-like DNA-binding protein